jgi:5,10-methenyltetrahydrofolate synthetase
VALPQFEAGTTSYHACQVLAPERDLLPGRFGILEPGSHCRTVPLNQLDLVLVPGVAFDKQGRRLGRGYGYYDRLLASIGGIKCAIAFDEQLAIQIPVESHDILLDCIVTPSCWLDVRQQRHGDELVG